MSGKIRNREKFGSPDWSLGEPFATPLGTIFQTSIICAEQKRLIGLSVAAPDDNPCPTLTRDILFGFMIVVGQEIPCVFYTAT